MQKQIVKNPQVYIPIFIIKLDSGTSNLIHYAKFKDIPRTSNSIFVFTMWENFFSNIEYEFSKIAPEEMDDDDFDRNVLDLAKK